MAHAAGLNDIQIDRAHGGAIRREIGEGLRRALDAEAAPMPAQLRLLLERLAHETAPKGDA